MQKSLLFLIVAVFVMADISSVRAEDADIQSVTSSPRPNLMLAVKRRAGNCPRQVGIWTLSFSYFRIVSQSDTVVVADTLAFAGEAKLVSQRSKFVQYEAPLRKAYADCNGIAIYPAQAKPNSVEAHYKFEFKDGRVRFTTQLDEANGFGFGINDQKTVGLRPYLRINFSD